MNDYTARDKKNYGDPNISTAASSLLCAVCTLLTGHFRRLTKICKYFLLHTAFAVYKVLHFLIALF